MRSHRRFEIGPSGLKANFWGVLLTQGCALGYRKTALQAWIAKIRTAHTQDRPQRTLGPTGFVGNDKASGRIVQRVQAPPTGEPFASADGGCCLRLSDCVFPGTEAAANAFFANPIKLQPAAAHLIFVDPKKKRPVVTHRPLIVLQESASH